MSNINPTFTAAEKAYFDSGGAVHPETGKPAEETKAAPELSLEQPKEESAVETKEAETADARSEAEAEIETEGEDSEEIVDVANQDGETRRKMIAFGAYEKQRKQAKALREQSENMAKQLAYLTGALEQVRAGKPAEQAAQPQPKISATPPDYKTQPEEWIKWVNDAAAHAATFTQQQSQVTEQQAQLQQLNQIVYQHEQDFIAGDAAAGIEPHPDFQDALKFVQERHRAELREAGYEPQEIAQIMTARAQDLAIRALRAGKSPAERIYAVAKQHGYKRAAPAKAAPIETEAAKVVRQADGQAKAKGIAALAGGAEKGLTIESLANTPMDKFQKLWKEGKPHELMGIPKG